MKKILFVATIHGHFMAFHIPYIKWFKDHGYEVHVAAKGGKNIDVPYVDKQIDIPIERNPFNRNNIKAIRQLKKIIETEQYSLVTAHTAMGGVVARLAGKKARKKIGLKMLYTAHGFHFFKGAPMHYWLLYYPMEKFLSRYTDAIITINQEDFDLVRTHHFKNLHTYKIPGIGLNTERLFMADEEKKQALRVEYGYKEEDFLMLYIAEFIPRKDHMFLIKSIGLLKQKAPNIKFLFAGNGRDLDSIIQYTKDKGLEKYVDFLGFRKDIGNLIAISDIGVSASCQEGLGMNLVETMFSGRPVVASNIRGHRDSVAEGLNGFLFAPGDTLAFVEAISCLYQNPKKKMEMGMYAHESVQRFKLENSIKEMEKIYFQFLPNEDIIIP